MTHFEVLPITGAPLPHSMFADCAEGSLAWFRTLAATTLKPDERAFFAALVCDGTPLAALPIVKTGKGARALTAPYTTLYAPPLQNAEAARELGRAARSYASGVLRLDGIDPTSPGATAFLEGLQDAGLAVLRYEGFANWYEAVSSFEAYWEQRPSRLRATVRRKLAAALKAGAEFLVSREAFEQALAIYEDIYRSSWKSPEPHTPFIPEMVRSLGREGLVRMGVMRIAGHPVAAQIWLVAKSRGTVFKLAHREDAAEHSPGTLLTFWMAQTLIRDEGLAEIDFGRGDDAYKRDWLGRRRTRIGIVAADWHSSTGLTAIVRNIVPALGARAIRKHIPVIRRYSATATSHSDVVDDLVSAQYRRDLGNTR